MKENQIDISKMTVEQLKALAYDTLVTLQNYQQEFQSKTQPYQQAMQTIQAEIQKRAEQQQHEMEKKPPVEQKPAPAPENKKK